MDCSTFAFDLHVLGTPPALILSQDQTLMLNSSPFAPPASAGALRDNSLTRGRLALRCSIRWSMSWSPPVASARTDDSGQPLAAAPRAGLSVRRRSKARALERRRDGLLCVLARTIQFSKNRPSVRPWRPAPSTPFRRSRRPRLGEPSKVTSVVQPCQAPKCRRQPTS
jgi:hypothetical protein